MNGFNNGGQAFPIRTETKNIFGMTLRDYFAAKAMQAIIEPGFEYSKSEKSNIAEWAYDMADAMIFERDKS